LWKMYCDERDRLVRASTAAVRAGVAEAAVRIEATKIALLSSAITTAMQGIFDELRLTVEQEARIAEVVPKHMRALIEMG
jgi:sulfite reductase beta subunit-like hemoprotein